MSVYIICLFCLSLTVLNNIVQFVSIFYQIKIDYLVKH